MISIEQQEPTDGPSAGPQVTEADRKRADDWISGGRADPEHKVLSIDFAAHRHAAVEAAVAELRIETDKAYLALSDEHVEIYAQFAAKTVEVETLRRDLGEIIECAESIHRNIDEDKWSVPQDDLWVPTIHAHATVILEDARAALAQTKGPHAREGWGPPT